MRKVSIQEKRDVYFYAMVTSHILDDSSLSGAMVSCPFTTPTGSPIMLCTRQDSVSGQGTRDFQRRRLQESRGKVVLLKSGDKEILVGRYSTLKKKMTLYATEKVMPHEIKILGMLKEHLTKNSIATIIDISERARYRAETKYRRGDRIIR